jgi:perosamine synthetase
MTTVQKFLERAVREVQGDMANQLHSPWIPETSKQLVNQALGSTLVSTYGPHVELCANALSDLMGGMHVALLSSGTVALQVLLEALGPLEGNLVLCPSLTFVATANAIVLAGGTPFFYDVTETFEIDMPSLAQLLESSFFISNNQLIHKDTGKKLCGIVVANTFGHVIDLDFLPNAFEECKLFVIEDAAAALGSSRDGFVPGSKSHAAILSFNGNKVVTAGGGGAVVSKDSYLIERVRLLSNTAKIPHKYRFRHSQLSSNLRMPALNAALLLGQLENFALLLEAKREVFRRYRTAIGESSFGILFEEQAGQFSNYWLNVFLLNAEHSQDIDEICDALIDRGIAVRPIWEPLHQQPHLAHYPRAALATTEKIARRIISLPSSPSSATGEL